MLEAGFLEEARQLFRRPGLDPPLPSLRTVGYRQAGLYLSDQINYDDFVERAITATRQLAKRQMTWLRADRDSHRFDCDTGNLHSAVRNWLIATLS